MIHQHFARILPIVGQHMASRRVALFGADAGAQVAELLAACGVLRWALRAEGPAALDGPLVRRFGVAWGGQPAHLALAAALCGHHGAALPWEFTAIDGSAGAGDEELADLVITAGSEEALAAGRALADRRGRPLIHLVAGAMVDPATWETGYPIARLAGAPMAWRSGDPFAAAAAAKALLLRGTPFARPDIEELLAADRQSTIDDRRHSSSIVYRPSSFRTPLDSPALRERCAVIAGCGSLGSLVALELARIVRRLVLVDGAAVSAYNPARQLYPAGRVGAPKAPALAAELSVRLGAAAPQLVAVSAHLDDEAQILELAGEHRPDLAVLLTGTVADFALARGLRAAGVPHLVGRCYPRARYWEAIAVPDAAAPCLGCLRGQLYTGPTPLPTPEEAARYAGAGDLQGEPATMVESGWAAACMAALCLQLLAPPGLRERWFAGLLAAQRTCLIGGAHLEVGEGRPAAPAYGISGAGQVRAYGPGEIIGSAATRICADCGRSWPVAYRIAG